MYPTANGSSGLAVESYIIQPLILTWWRLVFSFSLGMPSPKMLCGLLRACLEPLCSRGEWGLKLIVALSSPGLPLPPKFCVTKFACCILNVASSGRWLWRAGAFGDISACICTDYRDKKSSRMCQTGRRFTKAKTILNRQCWRRGQIITVSWYLPDPFLLCSNAELQFLQPNLHS